jgi:hypothetical protein
MLLSVISTNVEAALDDFLAEEGNLSTGQYLSINLLCFSSDSQAYIFHG